MEINRREIARYLGYRGTEPSAETKDLIEVCLAELEKAANPRHVSAVYPLTFSGDDGMSAAGVTFRSKALRGNLRGCEQVCFFAATLGVGVDVLIRRMELREITKGAILQAAGAAMIEPYCNEVQQQLRDELAPKGLYLRPRFSPGYGDLPLETQRIFSRVLKTEKTIGLTLTDNYLMVPMKSVTAFIGISTAEIACHRQGCEICGKLDCQFRLV